MRTKRYRLQGRLLHAIRRRAGTTIKKAIIDKNARIGANCSITNKDNVQEDFEHIDDGWVIKDYIVVIEKDCTIPDGTVI